jgi:hypothetical protein
LACFESSLETLPSLLPERRDGLLIFMSQRLIWLTLLLD